MSNKHPNQDQRFESWLQQAGQQYNEQVEPPEWDREAIIRRYGRAQQRPSWFMQSLIFASFALSCVAVSLAVVKDYKAGIDMMVAEQVEQQVNERLNVFEQQQKIRLAQHNKDLRSDFREQLSTSTTQLATYILATNREERKDDIQQLVEYVNDTREEDYSFYAQQLQRASAQSVIPILEDE